MPRVLFLVLVSLSLRADVCDPAKLVGTYGFQLSGTTTISGDEKPATILGRLMFDGHGSLSGYSSTMFSGYLLGNRVTGSYEAKLDCSLTWTLQDDSGTSQHFAGTISPDLTRGRFRQTDPGGPQHGILEEAPDTCTSENLAKRYTYTVSGSTAPMKDGDTARTISAKSTIDVARSGTFQVNSDCTVEFDVLLSDGNGRLESLHMRGILVNGGHEILAIETDPGAMVAGRFIADSK